MGANTPKILLVTRNPMSMSFLTARLKKWPCEVHFCSSCREADAFVSNQRFDLVLSEVSGGDLRSLSLAASLTGSRTTLIYSYPVETGCWWLPALKHGLSCWGSMAMRPSEFIGFLDEILKEIDIRSRLAAGSDDGSQTGFKVMAGSIADGTLNSRDPRGPGRDVRPIRCEAPLPGPEPVYASPMFGSEVEHDRSTSAPSVELSGHAIVGQSE